VGGGGGGWPGGAGVFLPRCAGLDQGLAGVARPRGGRGADGVSG
jgi:hypothetical protein